MRTRWLLPAMLSLMLLGACSDQETPPPSPPHGEEPTGPLPVITWAEASARFRMQVDETLMLVPDVQNIDSTTTYLWTMDGEPLSILSSCSFTPHEEGEYFIHLVVTNRFGQAEDEAKVTVGQLQQEELPPVPQNDSVFSWCFPWTEINIAQGRTIRLTAYLTGKLPEDATFSWSEDGQPMPSSATATDYVFTAREQGPHILQLTMQSAALTAQQEFTLNVCPPPGTHRRPFTGEAMVNKIHAYAPAPGHQVNGYIIVGDAFPPGCTHEQACDTVLAHFRRQWSVSLGSQGGYLIASFDHSVRNSGGGLDLCVRGNPFSYQSEPGIVWVSQDDNGDGLPNDQWFELAGSEYGTPRHATDYAITYYRPREPRSVIPWRDSRGQTGYVPYLSYWNPHDFYWQDWQDVPELTFFGSWLQDRSTYQGGYSDIPPYDWGYADNLGQDLLDDRAGRMNYLRLSSARTWDGQPVCLEYIDFIKIQTAQIGSTPNLGDISTEVYYISDYHCE